LIVFIILFAGSHEKLKRNSSHRNVLNLVPPDMKKVYCAESRDSVSRSDKKIVERSSRKRSSGGNSLDIDTDSEGLSDEYPSPSKFHTLQHPCQQQAKTITHIRNLNEKLQSMLVDKDEEVKNSENLWRRSLLPTPLVSFTSLLHAFIYQPAYEFC